MKPPLLDLPFSHWKTWAKQNGLPGYRVGQIIQWIYEKRVTTFDQMSNLPQAVRESLAESFSLYTTEIVQHQLSADGTEKLLLQLADGQQIESVLLRDDRGHRTVCLSTQVGCAMGCVFCASGLDGVIRNLTAGEILEQILRLQNLLPADERISHIVIMGMGEPLANLKNLLSALETITRPDTFGIGARRITISTVGLPPAIQKLAQASRPYHLAVSLHAASDPLRNRLIPANKKTGIQKILTATDHYFESTGRRVTFEYVLLKGINDRREDAQALASLLRGRCALVNLIPYNPIPDLPFHSPSAEEVQKFVQLLEKGGINVQVRYRKGDQIDAACGQLRRRNRNSM